MLMLRSSSNWMLAMRRLYDGGTHLFDQLLYASRRNFIFIFTCSYSACVCDAVVIVVGCGVSHLLFAFDMYVFFFVFEPAAPLFLASFCFFPLLSQSVLSLSPKFLSIVFSVRFLLLVRRSFFFWFQCFRFLHCMSSVQYTIQYKQHVTIVIYTRRISSLLNRVHVMVVPMCLMMGPVGSRELVDWTYGEYNVVGKLKT